MPELPEVETVRRGLERYVLGRTVASAQVLHPRAVRRHVAGAADLEGRLAGRRVEAVRRRGKYLWLALDDGDAVIAHLGMSGQLVLVDAAEPAEPHLRVRVAFADGGPELRFIDQRTFGGLALSVGGAEVPEEIAHIARDPLDPEFDEALFSRALRRRRQGLKRALLDQTLVSGIGAIYADESLWGAQLHWARRTESLRPPEVRRLLAEVRAVLEAAVAAGGTSFDALYVDVNGSSGWFDVSLHAYGQEGRPCDRCGTPIRRARWANRSAYWCPTCQPTPRLGRP